MPFCHVVALLLNTHVVEAGEPQNDPFAGEIAAYEARDRTQPPAPGGIVFYGSSSIRMWDTLTQDFPGYNVINRGFGGSQLSDCIRFVDRVVTPYRPRMVVIFAGTNDLASGVTANTVIANFRSLCDRIRAKGPNCRIAFLAINPAPSRVQFRAQGDAANAGIRAYINGQSRMDYIDVATPMLDAAGQPQPKFFREDMLHMKRNGYELWTRTVTPYLARR